MIQEKMDNPLPDHWLCYDFVITDVKVLPNGVGNSALDVDHEIVSQPSS